MDAFDLRETCDRSRFAERHTSYLRERLREATAALERGLPRDITPGSGRALSIAASGPPLRVIEDSVRRLRRAWREYRDFIAEDEMGERRVRTSREYTAWFERSERGRAAKREYAAAWTRLEPRLAFARLALAALPARLARRRKPQAFAHADDVAYAGGSKEDTGYAFFKVLCLGRGDAEDPPATTRLRARECDESVPPVSAAARRRRRRQRGDAVAARCVHRERQLRTYAPWARHH